MEYLEKAASRKIKSRATFSSEVPLICHSVVPPDDNAVLIYNTGIGRSIYMWEKFPRLSVQGHQERRAYILGDFSFAYVNVDGCPHDCPVINRFFEILTDSCFIRPTKGLASLPFYSGNE